MGATGWAIGIDVGGSKIAAGLLDPETGRPLGRRTILTRAERGGEAVLADVEAVAVALAEEAGRRGGVVAAVGLGLPEIVDPAGGIAGVYLLDWHRLPLAARLGAVAPLRVESDVRAAALAEARLGAGRAFRSFAYVSVGTGISSTLVIDGNPWPGARGAALVLSSGPLTVPCPRCGAAEPFVLETFAAGQALARRYDQQTGRHAAGAEAVVAAAQAGDPVAAEVLRSGAETLGSAIGWLVNVVDPEAVVVGGGLGSAGGPFWQELVAATRRHVWHVPTRSLPIRQAALGADAGWTGAALAALADEASRAQPLRPVMVAANGGAERG